MTSTTPTTPTTTTTTRGAGTRAAWIVLVLALALAIPHPRAPAVTRATMKVTAAAMSSERRLRARDGASPVAIDRLILGASPLAGIYEPIGEARAMATVRAALEAGFTRFDTAPHYGLGLSERRLGEGLRAHGASGSVKVYTKVGRVMRPIDEVTEEERETVVEWGNVPGRDGCIFPEAPRDVLPVLDYSAKGFETSHEDSLKRLGIERIEGLRIHDAETPERFEAAMEGGGVRALTALRDAGRVSEISLGMNDAAYVLRMLRENPPGTFDSVMMAGAWNLLDQDGYDVLLECQERGVRVHNAGVFASGLLVGGSHYKYGPPPDEVKQRTERWKLLAEEHGVPLPAVAIAFATTPAVVDACAVGVKSPEEVAQTIAWLHLTAEIPTALWSDARARGLLDPRAPVPSDA